jgi:hypothetical protein
LVRAEEDKQRISSGSRPCKNGSKIGLDATQKRGIFAAAKLVAAGLEVTDEQSRFSACIFE